MELKSGDIYVDKIWNTPLQLNGSRMGMRINIILVYKKARPAALFDFFPSEKDNIDEILPLLRGLPGTKYFVKRHDDEASVLYVVQEELDQYDQAYFDQPDIRANDEEMGKLLGYMPLQGAQVGHMPYAYYFDLRKYDMLLRKGEDNFCAFYGVGMPQFGEDEKTYIERDRKTFSRVMRNLGIGYVNSMVIRESEPIFYVHGGSDDNNDELPDEKSACSYRYQAKGQKFSAQARRAYLRRLFREVGATKARVCIRQMLRSLHGQALISAKIKLEKDLKAIGV